MPRPLIGLLVLSIILSFPSAAFAQAEKADGGSVVFAVKTNLLFNAAGSTIARQPDILAVETMAPLEVTDDVVRHTRIIGFAGGYDFSEGCAASERGGILRQQKQKEQRRHHRL